MTVSQLLLNWELEPSIVIGCALLLAVYFFAVRFKFNGKTLSYMLGVLVLFLALASPIDPLADDYLFSAHMLQHMMLGIIAPPLLIAGLPASIVEGWLRFPLVARAERILGYAPLALFAGIGTIWIWHLPYLYNLALENEAVHLFEHILFIVTGTMLWWPVLKPIPQGRLAPMAAIIYMGIASTLGMILGIIFTVADTTFYSFYAQPKDELGALKLIREDWGLTQLDDQKLGGAIMWEPMGAIFLWAMMSAMVDWHKQSKDEAFQDSERGQRMSAQNDERDNWKITGPKAEPERLPPQTVWPVTLSFGIVLLAFGVLTSWVLSVTGLIVFLFGAGGWVEDLRNDQL